MDKFLGVTVDLKSIWHIVVDSYTVTLVRHSFKPTNLIILTLAPRSSLQKNPLPFHCNQTLA